MSLDFKAINTAAWDRISELVAQIDPDFKREGHELVFNAYWRGEEGRNSLKANLKKLFIKDFASGEGFDPVKLWARHKGVSNVEAASDLMKKFGMEAPPKAAKAAAKAKAASKPIPAPKDAPPPAKNHYKLGMHTGEWTYRDASGAVLKIVRRYDPPGQKKEFRPLSFQNGAWIWENPPGLQPLYNLDHLAQRPKDPVLICEGEKAACKPRFPNFVTTTSGASDTAAKADWTPLQGREVFLWPDHDEAGLKYAGAVAAQLKAIGVQLRVVDVPASWPHKWDLADPAPEGVLPSELEAMIHQAGPWVGTADSLPAEEKGSLDARLAKLPMTEMGLADRFRERYGDQCLFNESRGCWIVWDGKRWADSSGRVELFAQQTIRDLSIELNTLPDDEKRGKFCKFMLDCQRASKQGALLTLAQPHLTCSAADLDVDLWLLNCPNGTLDLRTGMLLPHAPERRITKMAGAPFDPAASAPIWERFIQEITSSPVEGGEYEARPDLARALQLAFGYSLTGSVQEQGLFFLYGAGANGKGTAVEIHRTVLGDYARVVPASLLIAKGQNQHPHPADVATLVGVRFAIVQEVNKSDAWDEARMKSLTGGDALTARFMHGNFFVFTPQHKIFIAANHRPAVHDATHSFWRRMRMIPFDRCFDGSQKDPQLLDKLKVELPGILAWCVRGCLEWQKTGLMEAESATKAVEAYREDSDGFAAFMQAHTRPLKVAKTRAKEFKAAYESWAMDSGEPLLSHKQLWQSLQEYSATQGFKITKLTNNGTMYLGFGLLAETEQTEGTEGKSNNPPIETPRERNINWVPSLPFLPRVAV